MGQPAKNAIGKMPPRRWLDLPATAKRLGRCAGHLRKIAPTLAARGLSRRVKGKGKPHWEIRSDFQIDAEEFVIRTLPSSSPPIVISAGELLITVESTGGARVTIDTIRQETAD